MALGSLDGAVFIVVLTSLLVGPEAGYRRSVVLAWWDFFTNAVFAASGRCWRLVTDFAGRPVLSPLPLCRGREWALGHSDPQLTPL
jgi:hypothetical protein